MSEKSDIQGSVAVYPANPQQSMGVLQVMRMPPAMMGVQPKVWLAGTPGDWSGAGVIYPMLPHAAGWILVRPVNRRAGVGSALLQEMINASVIAGAEALRSPTPLSADITAWLVKHGFSVFENVQEFSINFPEVIPRLEKGWQRVSRQMPESAELITLDEADQRGLTETVSRFFAMTVGGLPMHLARLVKQIRSGQRAPLDIVQSLVLLDKGKVIGASHTHFDSRHNCWYTDSIAVDEGYRRGWANILLRLERAKRLLADGRSHESRFRFRDSQRDTSRFAEHVGATKLEQLSLLEFRMTKEVH